MRLGIIIGIILGAVSTIFAFLAFFSFSDVGKRLMPADNIAFFKDIVGPLAAGLGGAAAGAVMSAYSQRVIEKDKELDKLVLDYNSGVTILLSRLNELYSFRQVAIIPYQNEAMRFISIPSMPLNAGVQGSCEALLTPVMLAIDCAELLNDISLCEARYSACLLNQQQRDLLYEECRQRAGEDRDLAISLFDLKKQLGVIRLRNIYRATEGYIEVLEETISGLTAVLSRLNSEALPKLKARKPDRLLIKTGMKDEASLNPLAPPYFTSDAELLAAAGAAESPRMLALRSWRTKPYGY